MSANPSTFHGSFYSLADAKRARQAIGHAYIRPYEDQNGDRRYAVISKNPGPGKGRRFKFHGAFGSKAAAVRKERRVKHAFIRPTNIKGHRRYMVLTRNPRVIGTIPGTVKQIQYQRSGGLA